MTVIRRLAMLLAAPVLSAGAVIAGAGQASAAADCFAFGSHFQGSKGPQSIVIGSPLKTVGGRKDVGTVEIRDACSPGGHAQVLTGPSNQSAAFGFSSDTVDLNDDGYDDLVVGLPLYNVGTIVDAGAVEVYYGSPTGLGRPSILTQNSFGIPGVARAKAHFGTTVLTGTTTGRTPENVVRIGEPGRTDGSAKNSGGWVDLVYTQAGHLTAGTKEYTFGTPGVPGSPHAGALLGASLSDEGPVGAPGYPVAGHAGAGAVVTGDGFATYARHPLTLVTQDSPHVAGTAETGDHFGAALAGPWIGVPGEDLGSARDAGMVETIGTAGTHVSAGQKAYSLTASSAGLGGRPSTGDQFGASLSQPGVAYDYDVIGNDVITLFIGAPGTDTAHGRDSGRLYFLQELRDPGSGAVTAAGEGHTAGTRPSAHARLGAAMAQGALAVSAPGGTGVVYVYDEDMITPATTPRVYTQLAPVQSNVYGASLAG